MYCCYMRCYPPNTSASDIPSLYIHEDPIANSNTKMYSYGSIRVANTETGIGRGITETGTGRGSTETRKESIENRRESPEQVV